MDKGKLNVLFIAKNIPVPGIRPSRVVMAIAHELSSFCSITFLYPNEIVPFGFQFLKKYKPFYKLRSWNSEGFDISVMQYFRIPFRAMAYWFWNKLKLRDIEFYKKNGPFDLIHAHYLFPDGYLAFLYSKYFSVPYIITIRNADIRHLKSLPDNNPDFKKAKLIVSNAQEVLSLNLSYKKFIEDLFKVSSRIIPHGIELNALAEKVVQNDNKVVITVVAEAISRKNINWVINAFKTYKGQQTIELKIVGGGPLTYKLQTLATKDYRITFEGKLDRELVLQKLRESDIFALPSYDETFGQVYLEAAASGNAIIGLKNEGVWGIFENEKEMLFSEDEIHFKELIHKLIDSKKQRKDLSIQAYEKAKNLDWKNITEQYKESYTNAINDYSNITES